MAQVRQARPGSHSASVTHREAVGKLSCPPPRPAPSRDRETGRRFFRRRRRPKRARERGRLHWQRAGRPRWCAVGAPPHPPRASSRPTCASYDSGDGQESLFTLRSNVEQDANEERPSNLPGLRVSLDRHALRKQAGQRWRRVREAASRIVRVVPEALSRTDEEAITGTS